MKSIIWMSDARATAIRGCLSGEMLGVDSAREFLDAERDSETVSLIDDTTIAQLEATIIPHAIAISEEPLPGAVRMLARHPWLSHVISLPFVLHPMAPAHLANVTSSLTDPGPPRLLGWLPSDLSGRRVRLAHASKRVERLEKMCDYLKSKSVGSRTIVLLRDASEELLTNAFYNAPVAAGLVKEPISRTRDVTLPEEAACELVYGASDELAIVRVRDPFGSLSRSRLVEVLARCARSDMQVKVDETMGGAGLGLWRIFSAASYVAVSVDNHHHTEILVAIAKRTPGPRPFAIHLFFRDTDRRRTWTHTEDVKASKTVITVVKKK